MDGQDQRAVEAAAVTLVRERRVRVAVGDDAVAVAERGADQLSHVLRAIGEIEEDLRGRRDHAVPGDRAGDRGWHGPSACRPAPG